MEFEKVPLDLVHKIFSYLSYRERQFLKLCSKAIREAAINAPLHLQHVIFRELFLSNEEYKPQIEISFQGIKLMFSNDIDSSNATCMETKIEDDYRKKVIEKSNFREVAFKYLRNIVLKDNVTCGLFDTNCHIAQDFLKDSDIMKTKRVTLFQNSHESTDNEEFLDDVANWLKHLNSQYLKTFTVYKEDSKCSLSGSGRNLRCAEKIHILRTSDLDDNDLNQLTALDIEIDPAKITVKGVNQLIKKWINQKVPIGSRFVYYDNMENFKMQDLLKDTLNSENISTTKSVFCFSSSKFLHVWIDSYSVNVECMRRNIFNKVVR